jgi:hypothetical protein
MTASDIEFRSIANVSPKQWEQLGNQTIYFGHQSIGANVIEGIKDIMANNPSIRLDIVESASPRSPAAGTLLHSRVGENTDPSSKIRDFAEVMNSGMGDAVHIAFFKFCYIDIDPATDVAKLFEDYRDAMEQLRDRYEKTSFVHVTVPLRTVQTGIKVPIKKVIGRPIGGYADNIKRNEYNELLRHHYKDREPVFDLAMIESTSPDGKRVGFESGGQRYRSLVPEYTHDGRHLNELGRRVVAEQLLIFLAELAQ